MSLVAVEVCGRKTSKSIKGEFRGTRKFQVTASSRCYGYEDVSGLPATGEIWPGGGVPLYCSSVDAEEAEQLDGGAWLWKITANYEAAGENGDGDNGFSKNPLARPAVYSWLSANQIELYRLKDLDDKPFMNTAGDYFDPPPPLSSPHPVLQVRKNFPATYWSAEKILEYVNSCNKESYRGASAGYARIVSISVPEPKYENRVWYCDTVFMVEFRDELSWEYEQVVSEGPRHLNWDGKLVYSEDANNVPSTFSHLLDEEGKLLIDPNNVPDLSTVTPVYVQFRVRNKKSFKTLGI